MDQLEPSFESAINNVDTRARYDAEAKMLFSHKMPLAYIIQAIVPQFKGISLAEIEPYIDSQVYIESYPMREGTSVRRPKILGLSTESKIPNEGELFYDILFRLLLPNTNGDYVYINIEIQNNFYPGYDFTNRAVLYAGRLFSQQLERDFADNDYDKLKSIYSIWIFVNCPKKAQNSTIRTYLAQEALSGKYSVPLRQDLINLVFVHLGNSKTHENGSPLEQMLYTLLTDDIAPKDKITTLKNTFHMTVSHELEENIMKKSYLADALLNKGIHEGFDRGLCQGRREGQYQQAIEIAKNLLSSGLTPEFVLNAVKVLTKEEIEKISAELEAPTK